MSKLFDAAKQAVPSPAFTRTENGALALSSSGSAVLDWFSRGGAMRSQSDNAVIKVFSEAYKENKALALGILFYLRDIRGGQGERKIFRNCLCWLATRNATLVSKLIPLVPEYGRWDDLFALKRVTGKPQLYQQVLRLMASTLLKDAETARNDDKASISLLAKWAPSEGSAKNDIAKDLMRVMDLSPKQYRKLLTFLRKRVGIVEAKMCAKRWAEINYQQVPSRASMLYRKAFGRNDQLRYAKYLEAVKKGEATIHAGTLYPYELVGNVRLNRFQNDNTLEEQWKALPNYIGEDHKNALAVIDGSGSMTCTLNNSKYCPLDVAQSIGLYLAERNRGLWKGKFITFSMTPKFVEVEGETLADRVRYVSQYNEVANTNLQAVFEMILALGKKHKLSQDDMPGTIYVVSDMEFDTCARFRSEDGWSRNRSAEETNLEAINRKYVEAGYERPKIVFWNVASRTAQSPAAYDDKGIALFSGLSASVFKTALNGDLNPIKAMLDTIDTPRYQPVMELV